MMKSTTESPELTKVLHWHDALNNGDVDRLVTLVHEEVEVGGPRGTDKGVQVVREWAERAAIRLEPLRGFVRDERIVMAQQAMWGSVDSTATGVMQPVATDFLVRNGLIERIVRYPDLESALQAAGLTEADEVALPD